MASLELHAADYEELMNLYNEFVEAGIDDVGLPELQDLWARFVSQKTYYTGMFLQAQSEEMSLEQSRQRVYAELLSKKYVRGPAGIRKYEAVADPEHQELVVAVQEARTRKSTWNQYVSGCADVIKFLSRVMTARLEELRSGTRVT